MASGAGGRSTVAEYERQATVTLVTIGFETAPVPLLVEGRLVTLCG
jgi:hypothetical protein